MYETGCRGVEQLDPGAASSFVGFAQIFACTIRVPVTEFGSDTDQAREYPSRVLQESAHGIVLIFPKVRVMFGTQPGKKA